MLTAFVVAGYPIVIQFKKGKLWRILAIPGLFVLLANIIANYTELALVFGWPEKGSWTISSRVRRMQKDPKLPESKRELARMVQVFLDACEPDGKH